MNTTMFGIASIILATAAFIFAMSYLVRCIGEEIGKVVGARRRERYIDKLMPIVSEAIAGLHRKRDEHVEEPGDLEDLKEIKH